MRRVILNGLPAYALVDENGHPDFFPETAYSEFDDPRFLKLFHVENFNFTTIQSRQPRIVSIRLASRQGICDTNCLRLQQSLLGLIRGRGVTLQ